MSKSETYLTEQEIVDALVADLDEQEKFALKRQFLNEQQLGILHHGFGTHIRNEYKLWEAANPLTTQWFKDCAFAEGGRGEHQYMIDGVDYHPNHPDQVSFEIIKKVWQKVVE
jgi:predicted unusual protein kinase regulating ubiquinone biosynthesis (AarF/ABC1/UbiB family)